MKKLFLTITMFFSVNLFAEIVIISNQEINFSLEKKDITKIFLGKIFTLNQVTLIPVVLKDDNLKQDFLSKYLNLTLQQYEAYWTVRQYIGRGTTTVHEFDKIDEMMNFIKNNLGAIGYLDEKSLAAYNNNYKIIFKDSK